MMVGYVGGWKRRGRATTALSRYARDQPIHMLNASLTDSKVHDRISFTDRYRVGGELGSGASGSVYKALDTQTGEMVAAKFQNICGITDSSNVDPRDGMSEEDFALYMQTPQGQEYRQRQIHLRSEIAVQYLAVDSDFVIKLNGHFINADAPNEMVIIMELAKGITLKDYLARHPARCRFLPLPHMLSIMHQILLGLVALKRAHVIHRDLKDENIMVDIRDGQAHVKIVDLGLCKLMGGENPLTNSLMIGNHLYRAPECWDRGYKYECTSTGAKSGTYDDTADVWSAGLLFSQMLNPKWVMTQAIKECCRTPQVNITPLRRRLLHKNCTFDTVTAAVAGSQELADLINSMLQKEPGQRATVEDLTIRMEKLRERVEPRQWAATPSAAKLGSLKTGAQGREETREREMKREAARKAEREREVTRRLEKEKEREKERERAAVLRARKQKDSAPPQPDRVGRGRGRVVEVVPGSETDPEPDTYQGVPLTLRPPTLPPGVSELEASKHMYSAMREAYATQHQELMWYKARERQRQREEARRNNQPETVELGPFTCAQVSPEEPISDTLVQRADNL
ncbi:hypothetical protein KIPB_003006 [Kipferlia bialata]|uniref:Protein kinase domain-containing protein n=1 Tax=Kipferlia bialata TaxID=797122 RepID=A0A9K3CRI0_9EUKA|nr:hypothetical protein KIPB_003006 [Kipferlia bialata]|eukprot:g3006.t1